MKVCSNCMWLQVFYGTHDHKGLLSEWDDFYRTPTAEAIEEAKEASRRLAKLRETVKRRKQQDEEAAEDMSNVTPTRRAMRLQALDSLQKQVSASALHDMLPPVCHNLNSPPANEQGSKMKWRAAQKDGKKDELPVGAIVQVAVDNVDRAKLDNTTATLVVVETVPKGKVQLETMCVHPLLPMT
jgi:cysteinyl-tRNA synthetase